MSGTSCDLVVAPHPSAGAHRSERTVGDLGEQGGEADADGGDAGAQQHTQHGDEVLRVPPGPRAHLRTGSLCEPGAGAQSVINGALSDRKNMVRPKDNVATMKKGTQSIMATRVRTGSDCAHERQQGIGHEDGCAAGKGRQHAAHHALHVQTDSETWQCKRKCCT